VTTPVLDQAPPRWTKGRTVIVVVVLAMLAMWGYVLFLAIGPGRQPPPDRLADPAFGREAEAVCEAAHDDVSLLPPAIEAESATDRAEIIDEATSRFTAMIAEVATLAPDGEEGEVVAAWIADWRTYLGDRSAYAAALRADPDAAMFVTARDAEQVTEYIDAFAADNHMPACATPIDL
jgi:hypothetical protein